jgi:WD40 repeat protein
MRRQAVILLVCLFLCLTSGLSSIDAQSNFSHVPITTQNALDLTLLTVLEGNEEGWIESLAFSPDNLTLAAYGPFNGTRLWDMQTFESIGFVEGSDAYGTVLAFSPDGERLILSSQVWDIAEETSVYLADRVFYQNQIFDTVGDIVAVCDVTYRTKRLKFIDYVNGAEIASFDDGCTGSTSFTRTAFSPDGTQFAYSEGSPNDVAAYGTLIIFDIPSQTMVYSTEFDDSFITDISYSPDGQTLAFAADAQIHLLDAETFQEHYTLDGEWTSMDNFVYSPDGSMIAAEGEGGIDLWNMNVLGRLVTLEVESVIYVGRHNIAFSPDSTLLAAGTSEGKIYIWGIPVDE